MKFQLEFTAKLNCFKSPNCDFYFSGEIYNLSELAIKYQLVIATDVELLGSLFNKFGYTFFDELNGIFSFFIYHKKKDELDIVRDHLGLQSLFYCQKNGIFYFSNYDLNLCTILNLPFEELNMDYFISNLTVPDYHLMLHPTIKSLKYGHYIKLNLKTGETKEVEFWNPIKAKSLHLNTDELLYLAEQKIRKAINLRNNLSDKKGFHISGGIDCSTIAAIIQEQNFQKNRLGFSWSPDPSQTYSNLEFDERLVVQKTCQHLNLEPFYSGKGPSNKYNLDPRFSAEREIAVLEKAKQENINLLYSGYGGDEFISAPFFGLKITQLKQFRFSKILIRKKSLRKNLGIFLKEVLYPIIGIIPKRTINEYKLRALYLNLEFQQLNLKLLKKDFCYSSRRAYHVNALKRGHLNYNISALNYLGNQFGIRYSFPLLDKELVTFIFQLEDKDLSKLVENRPLLRNLALKLLPLEVATHKRKTDPAMNEQSKIDNEIFIQDFLKHFQFQEATYLKKFFNFDRLQIDSNHFKNKTFKNAKQKEAFCATIYCLSYVYEFKNYYEIYTK